MPLDYTRPTAPRPTLPARGGSRLGLQAPPVEEEITAAPPPEEGSGLPEVGGIVAGGAALAGAALLGSRYKSLTPLIEKVNAIRQQAMLSGLAVPKSMLGNVGAVVERSIETGSLAPLRAFFSRQTLDDAGRAYRRNEGPVGAAADAPKGVTLPGPMPGRIMGAMDEATQRALRRSGAAPREAENAVLQSPLTGGIAEALDSPVARYIHPFRRTPFNQFIEGLKRLPGGSEGSTRAKAVYMGAGAAHGAVTADDTMPVSLPLAMAGAARYGYPYGAAALAGRVLANGKGTGGIPSGMLPVSEYGVDQSVSDPLRPFYKPAALTALERMTR